MKTKSQFLTSKDIERDILYPQPDTLRSIYLSRTLRQANGRISGTLKRGDIVRMQLNRIVDCTKDFLPTHIVLDVFGFICGRFTVELCDLRTFERISIPLYD